MSYLDHIKKKHKSLDCFKKKYKLKKTFLGQRKIERKTNKILKKFNHFMDSFFVVFILMKFLQRFNDSRDCNALLLYS